VDGKVPVNTFLNKHSSKLSATENANVEIGLIVLFHGAKIKHANRKVGLVLGEF